MNITCLQLRKRRVSFVSVFELLIQAFFLFVCFLFVVFGLFFSVSSKGDRSLVLCGSKSI